MGGGGAAAMARSREEGEGEKREDRKGTQSSETERLRRWELRVSLSKAVTCRAA